MTQKDFFSIFMLGFNDNFEITEGLFSMQSLRGKMWGENVYSQVSAVIGIWEYEVISEQTCKLANVTTVDLHI